MSETPSKSEDGFMAHTEVMGARAYDLAQPSEVRRLLYEVRGYLHTCLRTHCGTDRPGRDYAIAALNDPAPVLRACNAHDDLLAALKQIAQINREKCEWADAGTLFMVLDNKVEIARAAIAKAEGAAP
jgi:hypothetical protein